MNVRTFVSAILVGSVASLVDVPSSIAEMSVEALEKDKCLNQAREAMVGVAKDISTERARLELEIAAARCHNRDLAHETAIFIGTVNSDRARFARDFALGQMTISEYSAALADRRRKFHSFKEDKAMHLDLAKGDADGDLIPDRLDRCPETGDGLPTDDRGCPIRVPERPNAAAEEKRFRQFLSEAKVLFNPSCDGAPKPLTPVPIAWGRGPQTKWGTHGFNLSVGKVERSKEGCEIFYEIELRFARSPNAIGSNPNLPPSLYASIVFRDGEDLLNDPLRAVFGIPWGPETQSLSAGRKRAGTGFAFYAWASWRIRAVNGSNQASSWSPPVTQGPAPSGVEG